MAIEPTEVQIRAQLERLLNSVELGASPRKQKFLKYVVEKTLAGEGASLKGYSIGVDVFDRGDDFDPQADTIVRVQARNLRRAVRLYNLTSGKHDPVLIKLHSGSYVPTFEFNKKKSAAEKDHATDQEGDLVPPTAIAPKKIKAGGVNLYDRKSWSRPLALLLFFVVIAVTSVFVLRDPAKMDGSIDRETAMPIMGPTISVASFELISGSDGNDQLNELAILRSGLHYELIEKLSRFKDIFVRQTQEGSDDLPVSSDNPSFLLTGSIQHAGEMLRVTSVLSKPSNGEILWTRTYDGRLDTTTSLLKIQSDIAVDVAATLGQPYSRLNAKFADESSKYDDIHIAHYRCLLGFYVYTNQKTESDHAKIRTCLERATSEMPEFSSGWAALSWMYADEYRNQFNVRVGDKPPMVRSLDAAQRAVVMDPDNARAYQYLAIAKFTLGDDQGFRVAAETALRLNPNDAEVLADVGSHLIQLDNSERGKEMVEKAIAMNPSHPSWYHGSIFMYFYLRGQTDKALYHGQQYIKDGSLAAHVMLTAVLVQDDQLEEAKSRYQKLVELYPSFPEQYDDFLTSLRLPNGMMKPLLEDLQKAGLNP